MADGACAMEVGRICEENMYMKHGILHMAAGTDC